MPEKKQKARSMKIECFLPEKALTNEMLSSIYDGWTAEGIYAKTGIRERRIAEDSVSALDLADKAANRLFASYAIDPQSIDFLLLCTQSSPLRLPSSSCLLQERLRLRRNIGALTIDHGCSGFVYGLAVAKGLLSGGMASRVLLITAETYSKYIDRNDRSTRAIFGDGAAATLLDSADLPRMGNFVFGTDGSGADTLTVKDGRLYMDGPEIFNFTLEAVPQAIDRVLAANGIGKEDIDLFVFHQANRFMLDAIRKVCALPREKFHVNLENTGNTVSSTIPIALKQLSDEGRLTEGMRVMLVGFGVGLSWGATIIEC